MKKKTLLIRILQIQYLFFGFPGFLFGFPGFSSFWVDNPNKNYFLFEFPGILFGFK
jgi:hypothetical protein